MVKIVNMLLRRAMWCCALILATGILGGYAQTETVVYNEYVKFVDYLYSHDSLLRKKLYIEENGTYTFLDIDEQGERILFLSDKRKMIRVMAPIVSMTPDSIEVIKNYFPKGMSLRWDSVPIVSLEFSYLLHLFSEPPLNDILEEDVIRVTYVNFPKIDSRKEYETPADYHFIEIAFRNDSAIMHYKEGKFDKGLFMCYEENRVALKKREVKHILKYDKKIAWISEPVTCSSGFPPNLCVIERKQHGVTVSLTRHAYCEENKSFWSMINLIAQLRGVRDNYLKNKIRDKFPF